MPLKMEDWLLGPFQVGFWDACLHYEIELSFSHSYLPCWMQFALIYTDRSVMFIIMSGPNATELHNEGKCTDSEF